MVASKAKSPVQILMYHSISDGPPPTCIPLDVFQAQLNVLQALGYETVSLSQVADWHRGEFELPARPVVLTFDDGFVDFAETASPEIRSRGWGATVFLPTGLIGGEENWRGQLEGTTRRLMTWDQVAELAEWGIEFGAHSVSHADLTTLEPDVLRSEIQQPQVQIQQRIGGALPTTFAPPYGRSNLLVREEIRKFYKLSVGTELGPVDRQSDLFDLPRIEMHYFRNKKRWKEYLRGRRSGYFMVRQILRLLRRVSFG